MSVEPLLYANLGVSVRLAENGLQVSDQELENQRHRSDVGCCGWCQGVPEEPLGSLISYDDILNCEPHFSPEASSFRQMHITYATPPTKSHPQPIRKVLVQFDEVAPSESAETITNTVLGRLYARPPSQTKYLILINPHGGTGSAVTIFNDSIRPILEAAHAQYTYTETKYSGHATDIARDLDIDKYDVIVCCSGDGIPHEVINGFYQRADKGLAAFNKIAVTQLPCGSGNALSLSSYGTNDPVRCTVLMLKSKLAKLDLMAITQGVDQHRTTKLSFLTQCYGAVADSDIGTENLRWMGPIRFELGCITKIIIRQKYPCDLYVRYVTTTEQQIAKHYETHYTKGGDRELYHLKNEDLEIDAKLDQSPPSDWSKLPDDRADKLTLVYTSKLPYVSPDVQFFPACLPSDGAMDMILVDTNSSILETLSMLTNTKDGKHIKSDKIGHYKVYSYRLVPKTTNPSKHFLSIDGESFPFEAFQVDMVGKALTILLPSGNFADTSFTRLYT